MTDSTNEAPVTPTGQADGQGDAHSQTFQVPEKLKGKSAEELAKSYLELEKKLGEQSGEVAEARKKVEEAVKLQTDALEARKTLQEFTEKIYADPDRIKLVQSWFEPTGDSANQNSNGQNSNTGNSQPSNQNQPSSADLDTRRALQDQIFDEFYAKNGIDKLPAKEKQEALQNISSEFAELFDSTGRKSITQIVQERPLASLRRDLDKAYRLVSIGQVDNQQGALAQAQNDQAAIGGLSSSTIREDQIKLTSQEEEAAQKLGIPSERYLERKKQMLKERGSVS